MTNKPDKLTNEQRSAPYSIADGVFRRADSRLWENSFPLLEIDYRDLTRPQAGSNLLYFTIGGSITSALTLLAKYVTKHEIYYWEWILFALFIAVTILVYLVRYRFDKEYQDIKAQLDDHFRKQRHYRKEQRRTGEGYD